MGKLQSVKVTAMPCYLVAMTSLCSQRRREGVTKNKLLLNVLPYDDRLPLWFLGVCCVEQAVKKKEANICLLFIAVATFAAPAANTSREER